MTTANATYTTTALAKHFGLTIRQVQHAIKSRGVSVRRVGFTRYWTEEDFPIIEATLRSTGALPATTGAGR